MPPVAEAVRLRASRCAICGSIGNTDPLYPPRLDPDAFTAAVFSARREPDRRHYAIGRCRRCGLVRSDPVAPEGVLERLYEASAYDYEDIVADLQATYGRYLDQLEAHGVNRVSLLEIGAGSGFFLEEALRRGYRDVTGVEPAEAAVRQAAPAVRDRLVCGTMRPALLPHESFDVACMFQVLDHLPDPAVTLRAVRSALRQGGLLLVLNHDVEAPSARLLGERSPIFDVEHTYLFSKATIRLLLESCGFEPVEVGSARNIHTLRYLLRMSSLPRAVKHALTRLLGSLGSVRLDLPLGNLYAVARRVATP